MCIEREATISTTMSIALVDATSNSLTVSWIETLGAVRYVLQYRKSDQEEYETLSDRLTAPQARKRNLEQGIGYYFRGGCVLKDGDEVSSWVTHSEPFYVLSGEEEKVQMAAPRVASAGNQAGLVAWTAVDNAKSYELQMRENTGGYAWKTIAPSLSGTQVRKKNLTFKHGYQFRVRPVFDTENKAPFSPASDPFVALGLSDGIKSLFSSLKNSTLLRKLNDPISLGDALGGKEFILLYASAHWCGPCRQFTPMLTQWYQSLGPTRNVEVVFLSADHDESGFKSYYSSMPWLAVAYDDDAREQLMGHIRVTGIPRLAVLDGRTGRIIEDNAVGQPLEVNRWRSLASGTK